MRLEWVAVGGVPRGAFPPLFTFSGGVCVGEPLGGFAFKDACSHTLVSVIRAGLLDNRGWGSQLPFPAQIMEEASPLACPTLGFMSGIGLILINDA